MLRRGARRARVAARPRRGGTVGRTAVRGDLARDRRGGAVARAADRSDRSRGVARRHRGGAVGRVAARADRSGRAAGVGAGHVSRGAIRNPQYTARDLEGSSSRVPEFDVRRFRVPQFQIPRSVQFNVPVA